MVSRRGWGKAVTVVELPGEPTPIAQAAGTLREIPEDLKRQIRQWLESRRAEYLAAERAEAEARMRSYLPDGNGDGYRDAARVAGLVRGVPMEHARGSSRARRGRQTGS